MVNQTTSKLNLIGAGPESFSANMLLELGRFKEGKALVIATGKNAFFWEMFGKNNWSN